ncbi:MAG: tetratricopeptide repeat protein [Desulfobacterium sp.]|nr:tetratricopeptide repeat protein [Desulfobacterium sp.]
MAKSTDQIILSRSSAMVFAVIFIALGFIAGVGTAVFKAGPSRTMEASSVQQGDLATMAAALESKVETDPADTGAWTKLGNIYYDTDQYEKAIHAYSKALETGGENPGVLCDMGVMYRKTGQPETAIKAFDRALAHDPKFQPAYLNKGIVLVNDMNDQEKAIQVWEALLKVNPLAMASKDQTLEELITHYKDHADK